MQDTGATVSLPPPPARSRPCAEQKSVLLLLMLREDVLNNRGSLEGFGLNPEP